MALQTATVTLEGRVAANVTSLMVDGQAVTFDSNGSYQVEVQVSTDNRVIDLMTTTTDGLRQTRLVTVHREMLAVPRGEA